MVPCLMLIRQGEALSRRTYVYREGVPETSVI